MSSEPFKKLLIRTAELRNPDLGFILAADPNLEAQDIEHTISFRWKAGELREGRAKFSAHSLAIVDEPEYGVVKVSASGVYSMETRSGVTTGNIFKNRLPSRSAERFGDIRSVTAIQGKAFAAGFEGTVYFLEKPDRWVDISDGLTSQFDIEAMDGFSSGDLYAVGFQGEVWHFNGRTWERLDVPTNAMLTSVRCCSDGFVYIGGHRGLLLRGRDKSWAVIEEGAPSEDIWDLEWFDGVLYASTMSGLYRCSSRLCEIVNIPGDRPFTTYQLTAAGGTMWSVGRRDILAFDGAQWNRVI